jgi:hypothetical protein
MSDKQADTETPKRGRPRGSTSKRQPVHRPVHRGPHGDDDDPDRVEKYVYVPHEARDKFYIQKDITDSIERDWGQKLQWMALEILGKPNDLTSFRQNLWEEVRAGDFEGQFDHFGIRDGIVCVERVALFRRPIEMHRKAVTYRDREAAAPIVGNIRKHSVEGVDVPMPGGGGHPSALAKNRFVRSYEPGPKIPDE